MKKAPPFSQFCIRILRSEFPWRWIDAIIAADRTRSPLRRDFVTIGRVSYCGDTARMRAELLPTLQYSTLADGLSTL